MPHLWYSVLYAFDATYSNMTSDGYILLNLMTAHSIKLSAVYCGFNHYLGLWLVQNRLLDQSSCNQEHQWSVPSDISFPGICIFLRCHGHAGGRVCQSKRWTDSNKSLGQIQWTKILMEIPFENISK